MSPNVPKKAREVGKELPISIHRPRRQSHPNAFHHCHLARRSQVVIELQKQYFCGGCKEFPQAGVGQPTVGRVYVYVVRASCCQRRSPPAFAG